MHGLKKRGLSFILALCLAATLLGGGLVPVAAAQEDAGVVESTGESAPEAAPGEEAEAPAEGSGEDAKLPAEDGTDEAGEPQSPPPDYDFGAIVAMAETDGAEAARMVNAFEDEAAFLAALRAVLDFYYGNGRLGAPFEAFTAAVDGRGDEVLAAYAEAAAERELDEDELGYVPGQVIVVFAEAVNEPVAEEVLVEQSASLEATVETNMPEVVTVADISLEHTVEAAVQAIEADPLVEFAQPVYVYQRAEDDFVEAEPAADFYTAYQTAVMTAADIGLDDPFAASEAILNSYMWFVNAINAPGAWELLEGLEGREVVRVAVIDTTQNYNHEDLQENVLWNLFKDFSVSGNKITGGEQGVFLTPDYGSGHGTHVTGTIAATAGNGLGTFGLAAGPDNSYVEVVPINVFEISNSTTGTYGSAYTSALVSAINYAVAQDARVINLSLGIRKPDGGACDPLLEQAVSDAVDAGVTVVAAAGNGVAADGGNGTNVVNYPSDLSNVIGVINVSDRETFYSSGSINGVYGLSGTKYPLPKRWYSSNYARGTEKDISAPGAYILATTNSSSNKGTAYYYYKNGTSMATPIVSSVVALLLYARPELTPAQVREIICGTALDLEAPGYDVQTAWGMVNAEAAVLKTLMDPPENLRATGTGGSIRLEWDTIRYADYYTVHRSTSATQGYTELAVSDINSYVDTDIEPGVMYYYMVSANTELDGETFSSAPGSPVACMTQLASPTDLNVSQAGTTSLTLTWNKTPGADGYFIYRGTEGPGPFPLSSSGAPRDGVKRISVTATDIPTYTDRDLDPGQNYYYSISAWAVRATSATNSYGKMYLSEQTAVTAPHRTVLGVPTSLRTAATGLEGPTLRWNAVAGATGYVVYGGDDPENLSEMGRSDTASYTDGTLAPNARRWYRVAALRTPPGGPEADRYEDESAPCDAVEICNYDSQPSFFTARSTGYNTVTLSWSAGTGVAGYHLYRATRENGPYTLAGMSEGETTFTDGGLAFNTTYYYRLYQYFVEDGEHRESPLYAQAGPVTTALATVTDLAATPGGNGVLKVSWSAVDGASGYYVYRAVGGGDYAAKPHKSLNAKTTAFTDGSLAAGSYRYKVVAWRSASGKKLSGPAVEIAADAPGLASPTDLVARGAPEGEADWTARLNWTPVPGAEGYYIYRSAAFAATAGLDGLPESEYTLVKTLAGGGQSTWADTKMPAGGYVYRVAAYTTVNRKKTAGAFSAATVTTGGLGAVTNLEVQGGLHGTTLSWSAPESSGGLLGYYVYRSALSPGEAGFAKSLKLVKTLPAGTTSHTEAGLAAGAYTYRVAGYAKVSGKKLAGAPTDGIANVTALAAVGLRAQGEGNNTAVLRWDGPRDGEDVLGYYVYRSALAPGAAGFEKSLKRIKTLSLAGLGGDYTYTDTPLAAGTYTYRVLPYVKSGGKTMTGLAADAGNNAAATVAALPAPALRGGSPGAYTVRLEWDEVAGASGYYVYRAGGKKAVKNLTRAPYTFTDTGVDPGKATYEVRAYYKAGGKTFPGEASSVAITVGTKPGVDWLKAENAYDSSAQGPYHSIFISWGWDVSIADGVRGYRVYREGADGNRTLLKTLSGKKQGLYEDKTPGAGTYTYYVAPYYRVSGRTLPGELRAADAASPTPLPAPQLVAAAPAAKGYLKAELTWEPLRNATGKLLASGYNIYRSALSPDEEGFAESLGKPVKSVSGGGKSFFSETLAQPGRYWYVVAPYTIRSGKKVEGTRSQPVYLDPATPSGVKLDGFGAKAEGIHAARLDWKPVKDTGTPAGYYIYQSGTENGTYTLAATVKKGTAATTKLSGLAAGKNWFIITPYFKAGKVTLTGVSTGSVETTVEGLGDFTAAPTVTAGRGSAKLSWPKVEGATSYRVYYRAAGDAAWTLAGSAKKGSKPSYTVTPLKVGSYDFRVAAVYTVNKVSFESSAIETEVTTAVGG